MRNTVASVLVVTLALLGGCANEGRQEEGDVAPSPEPRSLKSDEALAGAMTYWGQKIDIACPSRFDIPARPPNGPVDDIRGLRLGVSADTAIRFAQCRDGRPADSVYLEDNANFNRSAGGLKIRTAASVATGKFPERWPRRRNALDIDMESAFASTDAVWHFIMDGMPGKEKVYAVWLEQPFAEGAQPSVDSQMSALKNKYGEPNYRDDRGRSFWLYKPDGTKVPDFERDLLRHCSFAINTDGRSLQYDTECGLTIAAEVRPSRNNLLTDRVIVALFNPSELFKYQQNEFDVERADVMVWTTSA